MQELTWENTAHYLRETGRVPASADIHVRELSGGVSNVVLRVDVEGQAPFVIKQCRERLRVAMDWRARLDRIWAEEATLGVLAAILPPGTVPAVLFEDRPNYLFAMTCAPDDSATWKTHLMAGEADPRIAARLGTILGAIHADAPGQPMLHETLADTSLFDELRIDPYYRTIARAHPAIASRVDALIESMDLHLSEQTLVLGDFSPKNILVHSGGLILLDFECGHRGDAAFDLGFFLSHLLLKTIHLADQSPGNDQRYRRLALTFWDAYLARTMRGAWRSDGLVERAIEHTAACLLARVDGKSPVEYLDAAGQDRARRLALAALQNPPRAWDKMLRLLKR
ncbi:MAG: phosphotransferase family protein [Isosphaeraceae bacterium]